MTPIVFTETIINIIELSWNVKPVVGNILYVGSDGLSVLFQWQPEQPKKLFITLSGTGRVKAVLDVINEEMAKLQAQKKIPVPIGLRLFQSETKIDFKNENVKSTKNIEEIRYPAFSFACSKMKISCLIICRVEILFMSFFL